MGVVKNFHPVDPITGFLDNIHFSGKGRSGSTGSISEQSSGQQFWVGERKKTVWKMTFFCLKNLTDCCY